jgi:hypothetical protein
MYDIIYIWYIEQNKIEAGAHAHNMSNVDPSLKRTIPTYKESTSFTLILSISKNLPSSLKKILKPQKSKTTSNPSLEALFVVEIF